jgi:hypothetical protein
MKRLLNKLEKYSKWARKKYKDVGIKENISYDENGTLHEPK